MAGTGLYGDLGDGGPAISAQLSDVEGISVDTSGNVYLASLYTLRKLSSNGIISTSYYDNTGARYVNAVSVDASGNVYIADSYNHQIYFLTVAGIITTYAGMAAIGNSGDGGPATSATLQHPSGVTVDSLNNVYIADTYNNKIRMVIQNGPSFAVYVLGSVGMSPWGAISGNQNANWIWSDAGAATTSNTDLWTFTCTFVSSASYTGTIEVAADDVATVYVNGQMIQSANYFSWSIWHYDSVPQQSSVNVISGTNTIVVNAQNIQNTAVSNPAGLLLNIKDNNGNYVFTTSSSWKYQRTPGSITTYAGMGSIGSTGDGGAATSALLNYPQAVAVDKLGENVYVAEPGSYRIRLIVRSTGIITTFAGGTYGCYCDGGMATNAQLGSPYGVAVDASNNVYISDSGYNVIRLVTKSTNIITTYAGTGTYGFSGDGGVATGAQLYYPEGICVDVSGNVYIVDRENYKIRLVTRRLSVPSGQPVTNTPSIVIGTPTVKPTTATPTFISTNSPSATPSWKYVGCFSDNINNIRVLPTNIYIYQKGYLFCFQQAQALGYRYVGLEDWNVGYQDGHYVGECWAGNSLSSAESQGVATNCTQIVSTDGIVTWGGARSIALYDLSVGPTLSPTTIANPTSGPTFKPTYRPSTTKPSYRPTLYPNSVPSSYAQGIIITYAGGGSSGYGDGMPATSAQLVTPWGIALDASGRLYIADYTMIRMVNSAGIITTFAGDGIFGSNGDGGPATSAQLYNPSGVVVDTIGNVYIADQFNHKIRMVNSAGIITTFAGTGTFGGGGDGGPASSAQLYYPAGVAVDSSSGIAFIADQYNHKIRMVNSAGILTTFAGTGILGSNGDGGPASSAQLYHPAGVAVDSSSGIIFIADSSNRIIRMVNSAGIITTFAGTATNGQLHYPAAIAVDTSGNVFIADSNSGKIRMVDSAGILTTFAGTGITGSSGDGGPATSAQLNTPTGVAVDISGNVFIADDGNSDIRLVFQLSSSTTAKPTNSPSTTSSSNYLGCFSDDINNLRVLPTNLYYYQKSYLACFQQAQALGYRYVGLEDWNVGTQYGYNSGECWAGNSLISAESQGVATNCAQVSSTDGIVTWGGHDSIALYDLSVGLITTANPTYGPSTRPSYRPTVYPNSAPSSYAPGTIITYAGGGSGGYDDGMPATSAQLVSPWGIALDKSGRLYIADYGNSKLRMVNSAGILSTFAGTGIIGSNGNGGPATSAQLYHPAGVAVDSSNGNVFIADYDNSKIRMVNSAGIITTFAGTGIIGSGGDGGPATSAQLNYPTGVAVDSNSGNIFIAEQYNTKIRMVNSAGILTTFAGTGIFGSGGDGGPATSAQLNSPNGVAVDSSSGNIFIADFYNHKIRMVNSAGILTTFAGDGSIGSSGDGGPATSAQLNTPSGVAVDIRDGSIFISDMYNYKIRMVNSAGILTTFAGTGIVGISGDGGPATSAQLYHPYGVAVDSSSGNVFITDFYNADIRMVIRTQSPTIAPIQSAYPTNRYAHSAIEATQTINGITAAESTAHLFILAVIQGVKTTLGSLCDSAVCSVSTPVVNVVTTKRRSLLLTSGVNVTYTVDTTVINNAALISRTLSTSGASIMTTTLHNDGFPNAIALAPLLVTLTFTDSENSSSNLSSNTKDGLNLPALIGGIIGGIVAICCFVCGMVFYARHRGNQAPPLPIQDANVDVDTPPYVPPSPVNLSINLNQNNHYEIFNLDIEDAAFPEIEEEPLNNTAGTVASAPRFPRDYNNHPAYSL